MLFQSRARGGEKGRGHRRERKKKKLTWGRDGGKKIERIEMENGLSDGGDRGRFPTQKREKEDPYLGKKRQYQRKSVGLSPKKKRKKRRR